MGSNKLLASLRGKPVVAHAADAIRAAGLPALAVTGHEADAVAAALGPIPMLFAPDHGKGMAHSLATGIRAVDWDAAIICLGDMPLLDPALLRLLAARAARSAILVPLFEGRRGNPVLWGRDHFPALAALTGDTGGRALFDRPLTEIAWHDASILADVDTPEALAALER